MNITHEVGGIGEARVLFEAVKRGYTVSIPHGHDSRYDMIVDMHGELNRVQVKTTNSDGKVVSLRAGTIGRLNGNVISKRYTAAQIDWLVVYDITTDRCAFVPASELGTGMYELRLRFEPTKNSQSRNVRWFKDYEQWESSSMVEHCADNAET